MFKGIAIVQFVRVIDISVYESVQPFATADHAISSGSNFFRVRPTDISPFWVWLQGKGGLAKGAVQLICSPEHRAHGGAKGNLSPDPLFVSFLPGFFLGTSN